MDCKHCGKQLPEEAKFCFHCGQPVKIPGENPKNPETDAVKLRKWIIGGIALVGVIILVAVIGGIKNYNQRNADPAPEPEQGIEVFEQEELSEQEEPVLREQPEEEFDPDSVVIPDLGEFFLKERFYERDHGDSGHKYTLINIPDTALEGVVEELFDLLSDPKYQLELDWEDSYYFEDEGTTSYYYYFTYTGSNPNIGEVYISEDKDPYTFQLTIYDMWAEDGIFDIGVFFNENFEEVKSGKHTQQDVGEQIDYADREQAELEQEAKSQKTEFAPDSTIIPKLDDFYLKKRLFDKDNGDLGRKYEMKGFPVSSREAVLEELFALLAEPQYQLELDWEDSYYYEDEGTTSYYYYYTYTGTNPNITEVYVDEANDPYTFKISVWDLWASDGVFNLGIYFNENFEEAETGKHTGQDVGEQDGEAADSSGSNSGGVPDSSGLYDHTPPASKLKCLTCGGDGDCNTCGGSGYKRIGGAKAGCTTCRGNGKCRTCGGSGTR